ncbi:MAG: hypothetical protein PGN07_01670 [Aeromicrobium erythreum]
MDSGPVTPAARSLRTLAMALVSAPVVVLVAVVAALPTDWDRVPGLTLLGPVVAFVLVGLVAAETIGYRAEPLAADDPDPQRTALARFQQLMMLRLVCTEVPIIVAVAVSFAFDEGAWPLLVAVVVGLPALVLEVWPSRRAVRKVADALESTGTASGLPTAFGHA